MSALFSYLFIAPAVILVTVIMGLQSLLYSVFGAGENTLHLIAQKWARRLLKLAFIRAEVIGVEKLDPNRAYVMVANHTSYMDTPVIMAMLPLQYRFFAKTGLFKIPLLGTHLTRAGHFPVDRGNARSSLKTMSNAARALEDRKVSALLFPEGGRTEKGLREFKEGAAYIAIKAGVPIVPVGLIGIREVLPMHSSRVRPGKVQLRIGDPIETKGMSLGDRQELSERLHTLVAELIGESSGEPLAHAVTSETA